MAGTVYDMLHQRQTARRRRTPVFDLSTGKGWLRLCGTIAQLGAIAYWWQIETTLLPGTDWGSLLVAAGMTAILSLAPPALGSFLIPWSPAGMLLASIKARTWGQAVVLACTIFFGYVYLNIGVSFWSAQDVVANANMAWPQTWLGLVGFIMVPALLWTPVSDDELAATIKQDHLVRRYELQTKADIGILRAGLIRAQGLIERGWANLNEKEREELANALRGLIMGIDGTLAEIKESVRNVSGGEVHTPLLAERDEVIDQLDYLVDAMALPAALPEPAPAPRIAREEYQPVRLPSREEQHVARLVEAERPATFTTTLPIAERAKQVDPGDAFSVAQLLSDAADLTRAARGLKPGDPDPAGGAAILAGVDEVMASGSVRDGLKSITDRLKR